MLLFLLGGQLCSILLYILKNQLFNHSVALENGPNKWRTPGTASQKPSETYVMLYVSTHYLCSGNNLFCQHISQ